VYYTTQKKVNEIYCQRAFPLNDMQLQEISDFKRLMQQLNQSGGTGAGVSAPVVGSNTSGSHDGGLATGAANGDTQKTQVATSDKGTNRAKLALADLLATMPHVGSVLNLNKANTTTGETLSSSTERIGSNWMKGIAGVAASVKDKLNLNSCSTSGLLLFVIFLILVAMYIRLWTKYRKDKEAKDIFSKL
jgi:hypothetical protein